MTIKNRSNKLSGIVIGSTLVTTIVCLKAYEPNAYEVSVNGNTIAYVTEKSKAEEVNKQILYQINSRFNKDIKDKFILSFNKVIASENAISSDTDLKENMLNALNLDVNAVVMKADNKDIGVIANQGEGSKILDKVSQYYLSKCSMEDKKVSGIKNQITYIPSETNFTKVMSWEDIAEGIIKNIAEGKKSDISVEITGRVTEKVPVSYKTVIDWDKTLEKGKSKTVSQGQNGLKQVDKEIKLINGVKSSEKVVKETILVKSKDMVIMKGSKNASTQNTAVSTFASTTSAMTVLNRGSVTSEFGMRWGKMHNGIDIGSPIGTPIYAAMNGKVTFAGWESGYGYVIKLAHDNGILTIYGHCSSLKVKSGESVAKGQLIGNVGNTGNSTGPHLHFEVRVNGDPVNPVAYLWRK